MKFLATRFECDGLYSERFEAKNWTEAVAVCDKEGWWLDGELKFEIDADQMTVDEANGTIAALNEAQENTSH